MSLRVVRAGDREASAREQRVRKDEMVNAHETPRTGKELCSLTHRQDSEGEKDVPFRPVPSTDSDQGLNSSASGDVRAGR